MGIMFRILKEDQTSAFQFQAEDITYYLLLLPSTLIAHGKLPIVVNESKGLTMQDLINSPILWPLALMLEVFIYSSYGILINLSSADGHATFESASLSLAIEMLKLIMSVAMVWQEFSHQGLPSFHLKHVIPFAVPALCYCFNSNISVYMQAEMDPATFQVLCNLKIASTAILYRVIIRRKLSNRQWLSLVLLSIAGGLNGYQGLSDKNKSIHQIHVTGTGLVMTSLYCLTSGFAGVFTEYILKKDSKIPLPVQNCFLYSFGIVFNFCIWAVQSDGQQSLFRGYSIYTWAAILTQALNGLMMSLIMKYSSNIVRLFVISLAIPVATVLSMLIFHLQPDFSFIMVIILVLLAVFLYNTSK